MLKSESTDVITGKREGIIDYDWPSRFKQIDEGKQLEN